MIVFNFIVLFLVMASSAWAAAPEHTFAVPERSENSFLDTSWYARVYNFTDVYTTPAPSSVVRNVGEGFLYSTLHGRTTAEDGSEWYMLNYNEYVPARSVKETQAPTFQGTVVQQQPERVFGWIVSPVRPSSRVGGLPNTDFLTLQRYDFFQVYDAGVDSNDLVWYNIGGGRWIMQHHVSLVDVNERPEEVGEDQFWVEVDLYEQTVAAYEGDRMVYASIISSGLDKWPTREGLFQVWARLERTKMSGSEGKEDYYFIEEVPHTLYFDGEIALHGAYWHDDFGYQHSHGCVNMAPRDSEWVFNWSNDAPTDLWVWVHTSDPVDLVTAAPASDITPLADVLSQTLNQVSRRMSALPLR